MPHARIKTPRCVLAVLLGMCIVMPGASQKATNTGHLLLEEASRISGLAYPTQYHHTRALLPLESSLFTANQPLSRAMLGLAAGSGIS